ncbi:MAG: hypothetical protein JWL81_2503 [Verrucomicrobiales bacterium]|nr:hypothetical protein [Verrucomicrobiales bacterium]
MTPRALTPLFRCLEKRPCRPPPPEIEFYPAKNSGNHVGESHFLALATALLAATALVPATAGIAHAWLRWPLTALLIFLVPHLLMTALSWIGGWISGKVRHRGTVQDWTCLAAMTGYAAWRGTGAGAGVGWEAWVCQGWLIFAGLNLLLWMAGCGRVEATGPAPVMPSNPPA